jgi:hypothetical protein
LNDFSLFSPLDYKYAVRAMDVIDYCNPVKALSVYVCVGLMLI